MPNKVQLKILEFELCLSFKKLRKRTDLLRDIIPEKVAPSNLQNILKVLSSTIGSKETEEGLPETDRNDISLLCSLYLTKLNELLTKDHCLNLEEMLDMEIDMEHLEEVLAAIVKLLSQNEASPVKRKKEESDTPSKKFKSDIKGKVLPAAVTRNDTQVNKPLMADKESTLTSKDVKASTSQDYYLEPDAKPAPGAELMEREPATDHEISQREIERSPELSHRESESGPELSQSKPEGGPELSKRELPIAGPEFPEKNSVISETDHSALVDTRRLTCTATSTTNSTNNTPIFTASKQLKETTVERKDPCEAKSELDNTENDRAGPSRASQDIAIAQTDVAVPVPSHLQTPHATVDPSRHTQVHAESRIDVVTLSTPSQPSSISAHALLRKKSKILNKSAEADPEQAKISYSNNKKENEVYAKHSKNDTGVSKGRDEGDNDDSDLEITSEEIQVKTKVPTNQDNKFELASPSQVTTAPMINHIQDKSAEAEDHCENRTNKKTKQVKSVRQQSTKSCLTQSIIQPAVKKCCLRLRCIETIEDFDNVKSFVINLPQYDKEQLIKKYVAATPCKTRSVNSKRSKNRTYYLPTGDCPEKVICKVAFMNLIGICSDFIDEVLKPDRNKMSNNNSTTQEEYHEDQLAVHNLINTGMTENPGIIPSTVDEIPTVVNKIEDSDVSLKACEGDDKNSEPGGIVSHNTLDYQEEEVKHIQSSQQQTAVDLNCMSNTGRPIIYTTSGEMAHLSQTSTEIVTSATTSDIIANANKAVSLDYIYQTHEQPAVSKYEQMNTMVEPVNVSLNNAHTGNIQLKRNSPSQNEKIVPYFSQTWNQNSDINNQNEQSEFLIPSPYQKPVVNKLESRNKFENDIDIPSPLPFESSPGTVQMASDFIQDDLPASPSVSSSYTSSNMYKRVYPGKPQAVVPPKKRPQPSHTTVGKRMHSVNGPSSNITAPQQYGQRVLTPEQVTEIQKIYQTNVLHLEKEQTVYDVNIIFQQIKNLHDLQEIRIWWEFANNQILEELIKQQCNLKKLVIESKWFPRPENISYIAQGLADQAGTVEELDLSQCKFTGDQLQNVINTQRNLTKLNLTHCYYNPGEEKALAQGLSYTDEILQSLELTGDNKRSVAGDVSKALLNHHNLCKLNMSECMMEPDDVKALCEGLSQMKGSLQELKLSNNYVGSAAGDVSKALINHHKPCKLDMSECEMEPDDVKALCEGLSQMKGSLEELNLRGNNVGSAAGDVSKALINHHKLCKLNMSECEMKPDDVKALCEGLSQMKGSLQELNLSNNYVGSALSHMLFPYTHIKSAAGDVSKALINHHKLCKLDMSECKMKPYDVKALCEGLSQMKGSLEELYLSNNNVGSAAGDVSKALINHHKLCKLDMERCKMRPVHVKALCEGLSQMKGSLEELYLSNNNVGSAAGDVSKALINHHKLCKMDMKGSKMEPDDVKALCEGLSQMKGSLQELDLSYNNVRSAAGDVSKTLLNHHKLCKLYMRQYKMQPGDVKAMCEGLRQMKGSLEELNLGGNNVGSAAGDVSKALINHHKMCKLDMWWCVMKPVHVKALCEGLSQMKGSLEELVLRDNYVGSAAGDVSKALINHHKLCKLDMCGCKMKPAHVKALCEGLSQMKGSLEELNLGGNNVGSAAGDVSKALINHHKLCKLNMWGCEIYPNDVKALCEGLSQMKGSLEELDLSHNNVGSAAGDVSKALINHHKLCKLDMERCKMGHDDVKALCEGLSQMKGSLQELNLYWNNTGNKDDIKQKLMKKQNLKIRWYW